MKIDFVADTNFLIYVHEGNKIALPFLEYIFRISFISEVELFKEQTINLRRKYNIKLPDVIIASTSLVYGIPLVTADKNFAKITELDMMLIEV
ncbi:MAG: PIN domain-containing protein [Arachidicoccus sp.]|nr:PIN domain-containing protein [Arachidicoccus sp.]